MSDNEETLRRAIEAFHDRDRREQYLELYDPDVVLHGYPEGVEGLEGARRFYEQVWEAFPDADLTLEETVASGDRIAARYTLSGHQVADLYGAPAGDRPITITGMVMLRFKAGRVVEEWQAAGSLDTVMRLAARAAEPRPPRRSAFAEAAALRVEEREWEQRGRG
jgi:predicted ester cyclase